MNVTFCVIPFVKEKAALCGIEGGSSQKDKYAKKVRFFKNDLQRFFFWKNFLKLLLQFLQRFFKKIFWKFFQNYSLEIPLAFFWNDSFIIVFHELLQKFLKNFLYKLQSRDCFWNFAKNFGKLFIDFSYSSSTNSFRKSGTSFFKNVSGIFLEYLRWIGWKFFDDIHHKFLLSYFYNFFRDEISFGFPQNG